MQLFITFGHPLDDERLSINDIKELELHCVNEKNNLEIIRIPIGQNSGGFFGRTFFGFFFYHRQPFGS
jgi:hypothetical protein